MNKTLEVIKKLYKPYRYTIKNNCTIIETNHGKFVVKEKKERNIRELYNYLRSRNFTYFPNLIDDERNDLNVYEYVEEITTPKEQKALDLINLTALLHNKTSYFKEVSSDTYQEIYDNINNNILYLQEYYTNLILEIENEIYMSPSHYLLIRNSSKIFAALNFSKRELDDWFELVKEESKTRVSVIHNNLSTEHLIRNQQDFLISWDRSKIDSPVLDIIKFYQNEYFDLNFEEILNRYMQKFPLNEAETRLLFIMISLPKEVKLEDNEFKNCQIVRESLDYIYKTEELTRPYYPPNDPDEETQL